MNKILTLKALKMKIDKIADCEIQIRWLIVSDIHCLPSGLSIAMMKDFFKFCRYEFCHLLFLCFKGYV